MQHILQTEVTYAVGIIIGVCVGFVLGHHYGSRRSRSLHHADDVV